MKQYTIAENAKFNSLEISFIEKPDAEIRTILKSFGFRWNPKKSIWYGFAEREELEKALADGKPAKKEKKETDGKQSELMKIYMLDICEEWQDEKMREYCRKKAAYIVELENGHIMEIEKPSIETRFCFGHGMYGVSSDDEMKEAAHMAHYAATNESYFFNENMKQITEKIESYKKVLSGKMEAYKFVAYSGLDEKSHLRSVNVCRLCSNPEYAPYMWSNYRDLKQLSKKEVENIIEGLEVVKTSFEKRLKTYLKKYGTSKIDTWTYLRD